MKIIIKQNYDRIKFEEKKKVKYNPDNIFKDKIEKNIENTNNNSQMTEYKKESLFNRIKKFLLGIFKVK